MQVDEIADVSMPRVLTRPSKRGNDSFFPFHPVSLPCVYLLSLSFSCSLCFSIPWFLSRLHHGRGWMRNVGRTIAASLGSPLHCSARCSPDSWHETAATQRYTRACLDNKKAKKKLSSDDDETRKRERERETEERKMGTKLCFVDGLKMPWGQRERGFMTIRWFPMSRWFHVTEVVLTRCFPLFGHGFFLFISWNCRKFYRIKLVRTK